MLDSVLITGGSRGIGAAMVRLFAASGMRVAFTYKNSKKAAEELAQETKAHAIYCDVADEKSVREAVSKAAECVGDITVLINNAGISMNGLLCDMTTAQWRLIQATNSDSMFYTVKNVLPMMMGKGNGRIINISSVWGVRGAACEAAYSASKSSVIGFTKALAKELALGGITVNAIAPGVIDTDMNGCYSEEEMKIITDDIPMGRIARPEEVAYLARFLASEEAAYITGQVIGIDGGFGA